MPMATGETTTTTSLKFRQCWAKMSRQKTEICTRRESSGLASNTKNGTQCMMEQSGLILQAASVVKRLDKSFQLQFLPWKEKLIYITGTMEAILWLQGMEEME